MQHLPDALAPLSAYKQFIVCKIITRDSGKADKVPLNPATLAPGSAYDNNNWMEFNEVVELLSNLSDEYRIGFVLTNNDPFYCVDIDNCRVETGWSDVANNVLNMLPGAAVEVSQSLTGLHVFGMYTGEPPEHACKNTALNLEMYTSDRFIMLSGVNSIGDASTVSDLSQVVGTYFPSTVQGGAMDMSQWTTAPVPEWNGITDDDQLLAKACETKSAAAAFGTKATFADLWKGDISGCNNDASSADAAMASHLAWWTGKNCDRIKRIMLRSSLKRDKWDREDYLHRTILKSVSLCDRVYGQGVEPVKLNETNEPQVVSDFQFLGVPQQLEHFNGCYYVQDIHRIFTPEGSLLKPEQFNASYGGYSFAIDYQNKTTKKPFEAFTESQLIRRPIAHSTCFRPDLTPGGLIQENDGRRLVNTYIPVVTPRAKGDVQIFLTLLHKLMPNEIDREIYISFLAAMVQYKGVKFPWAPLLQGVEGNGKTFFSHLMTMVLGKKFVHSASSNDLANAFNAWIYGKLLVYVEDVYVPGHKQEVIEVLKPMISNDMLEVQAKGRDQIMTDNRANFLLNSNHKDAIRKTANDRRFAMVFTAQQAEEDLARDGMTGDFFPNIYHWLRSQNGAAHVHEFLATYPIKDEFNPATHCHRAPKTSSTDEAIEYSLGGVEQQVLEAIGEGRKGFRGGWVSSMALNELIESLPRGMQPALNKRREVMRSLGYDYHPGLSEGRVSRIIMSEQGKPRLYVKRDHPAAMLTGMDNIIRGYEAAQGENPLLTSTAT
jgi:hypothetical protein